MNAERKLKGKWQGFCIRHLVSMATYLLVPESTISDIVCSH